MRQVLLLLAVFFIFTSPASAQGYHVPGSYPESPAIRNAGGAENARAIAQSKGWQPYQLTADTPLRMRDAGGGWTGQRIMPRGTWMGATSSGSVHVIGYVDAAGVWHGCGNLTDLRIIVHTRVVEREVVRTQEVPVQNTVYVFGPTVYPTAPMPQPSVQYTARPPVYANWNFSGINVKSPGNQTNLFNGQSSYNGNSNAVDSTNFNVTSAEGGQGGSVGDITTQNNNASTSQSQNVDPDTTVVNTGSGNAAGDASGAGFQGGNTQQGNR